MDILPRSPYGAFNPIDLFVRDLGKGSTFAIGEFALVLQNEFNQKRCPAIESSPSFSVDCISLGLLVLVSVG
jgi:hypothetical protein